MKLPLPLKGGIEVIDDPFHPAPLLPEGLPACPEESRGLLDPLSGLYRRDSSAFLPLARTIAEVLARISLEVKEESRRWEGGMEVPGISGSLPSRDFWGTARGLQRILSGGGAGLRVWAGAAVRAGREAGELVLVRSEAPSAVLAWAPETDPAACDPARIPAGFLPPGTAVAFVKLQGPAPCALVSGERFRGEILT